MLIGEKIAAQRVAQGWTQEELAAKLYVSRQTVSKWELDKSTPDLESLAMLCALLQLDVRKLVHTPWLNGDQSQPLLAAPVLTDIARHATRQPFYVQAHLGEAVYPKPVTQARWLQRQLDAYRFAKGTVSFEQRLTIADEKGQQFVQCDSGTVKFSIGLLRSMRMNARYLVLLSVGTEAATYRLLIPTPQVIPALCDWLVVHATRVDDPMQLTAHRDRIDWKQLHKPDFEKLAINTPYWLPYQLNAMPQWS